MWEIAYRIVLALTGVTVVIGTVLICRTLRSNHKWAKRRFALDMLQMWNDRVYPHFKVIEHLYPHIRLYDHKTKKYGELTKEAAQKLWSCETSDADLWRAKTAMLELLNYFEFVTTAYATGVADKKLVEQSFKYAMVQWHAILDNFIIVAEEGLGFQPWSPSLKVIQNWRASAAMKKERPPTA